MEGEAARGWRRRVRFHDLRHTVITELYEGQASDMTVMSIAGHISKQITKHVTKWLPAESGSRQVAESVGGPEGARTPDPMVVKQRHRYAMECDRVRLSGVYAPALKPATCHDSYRLLPFLTEVCTKMVTKFSCLEMPQRGGA